MSHALLVCAIICAVAGPASAKEVGNPAPLNHFEQIQGYTTVASTAFFAQKACPGVKAHMTTLLMLRTAAKITDAEEALVDEDMKRQATRLGRAISEAGPLQWCASVWSLFGPSGSVMKGAIYRE